MEQAAVIDASAGHRWGSPLGRCVAVALALVLCPVLWAQDAPRLAGDLVLAEARIDIPVRLQVTTSALPRMEALDGGFQAPRVDVALLPANASGLGPVLGMSTPRQGVQPFGPNPNRPSVDFGLRWSHRLQSQQKIDVTAWRRMNTDDDAYTLVQLRQPVYGARVEMNLSPARRSGFAAERGFIGVQLEGGARITLKRKDGRPMVYYRTSF
jgi:hypothetical protein